MPQFVGTHLALALTLLFQIPFSMLAQKEITWEQLQDVEFDSEYNEETLEMLWYAHFGEAVKQLEGEIISITGYVIPFRKDENLYALSAYPFAACFFCGNAGPESVIELKFKTADREFNMDDYLKIQGVLRLNADNPYKLNYVVEKAKVVEKQ